MDAKEEEVFELGHHEFAQRIESTRVELMDGTGPLVRLVTAVQAHPTKPPGPGRHRGATTLAIRMDQVVAIELAAQIYKLARTMGWPLPP